MKKDFPKCNIHTDCFANKDGYCITLKITEFPDNACPFYRTKNETEKVRDKSFRRLVAIGREDLIEKYGGRKTNEHQQI